MNYLEDNSFLKFVHYSSVVDNSFWHKLSQLKLDIDKLEEKEKDIWGWCLHPTITSVFVDYSSFNCEVESKLCSTKFTTLEYLCSPLASYNFYLLAIRGKHKNFNSQDGFKDYDKTSALKSVGDEIKSAMVSGEALEDPMKIFKFLLLSYADLKSHEYYYWFGFPAPLSVNYSLTDQPKTLQQTLSQHEISRLVSSHQSLDPNQRAVFGYYLNSDNPTCINLKYFIQLLNQGLSNELYLVFLDPSTDYNHPGWPLRNLLPLVYYHWTSREDKCTLKVICLRVGKWYLESPVLHLINRDDDGSGKSSTNMNDDKWVGWERNSRGKLGPRLASLKQSMDPARLCESSAELNLKLMKWRIVPSLDLEIISSQKCLILGAGTLGCSIARNLMGWGVKEINFVDNGMVSYSNPVRQSLFTIEHCSKPKAIAASQALQQILPSIKSVGHLFEIPMPGHPTANIDNVTVLHNLISNHDVVFLVTDSRESRWLPTLIAASLNKLAITAALGFDSYLVMRHGIGDLKKLGCYFCNDITAPGNSKIDRTLDQQCTVTRPGVSNMAASIASELMVSLLQHPKRGECEANDECLLGSLPHSIRGFLSTFSQVMPSTEAFSKCIACSDIVIDKYRTMAEEFLDNVFKSNDYLEEITGLKELQNLNHSLEEWGLSDDEKEEEDRS